MTAAQNLKVNRTIIIKAIFLKNNLFLLKITNKNKYEYY